MKTIREVKIKIESLIETLDASGLTEGDAEKTVSECSGFLHYNGGDAHLSYRECSEGGDTYSDIDCKDGRVTVRRKGAIVSELVFVEGETHRSVYSVPPYKFDAEVRTRRVRFDLTDTGGIIDILYNMKIGGAERSARMKIWIKTV